MAQGELCFYTICDHVDELDDQEPNEARITFGKVNDSLPYGVGNILLIFPGNQQVKIDATQLTELGALLIALGGGKIDEDDVMSLFDGYGLGLNLDVHSTFLGELI